MIVRKGISPTTSELEENSAPWLSVPDPTNTFTSALNGTPSYAIP